MNEGFFPQVGFSIFFCLPGPLLAGNSLLVMQKHFTSTCGEQPFNHTKSKASAYEYLILASTPGKSLRRSRKDNNRLEKFDTY